MEKVNALIRARMQSENAPRIPEVSAHLIDAGGKRIRPMLVLASAGLCDYQGDYHIHLAATVEFIHTATLLHDDVVDKSDKRRGRPTANLLWDNKSSVLVGDYLFSRSFQLMVETGSLKVLDILANASAVIAEGEVLQLSVASNIDTSEAQYYKVIEGKTAALFAAACEVGGEIAGVDAAKITALRDYGMNLGMSFQIADDILDFVSDKSGKAIGNDFQERKLTLPIIRAIDAANDEERAFWQRTITRGDQNEDDLAAAIALIEKYDVMNSCRETAYALSGKAKDSLDIFEDSETKTELRNLADYVVSRLV